MFCQQALARQAPSGPCPHENNGDIEKVFISLF